MSEAEEYGPGGFYEMGQDQAYDDTPQFCYNCGSSAIEYVDDADGWSCLRCGASDADE